MNPEELQTASFRGVQFFVTDTSTTGGRRIVKKLFPNSDRQSIEDLGLVPKEFTLTGTIAPRRDAGGGVITPYREVRDALLRALDQKGPGVLIHPFLGRIESVSVQSYSFRESTTQLGDSPIDITFAVNQGSPRPVQAESVVGSISEGSEEVFSSTESDVSDRFEVTDSFAGNFVSAVEKVVEVADKVLSVIDTVVVDGGTESFTRDAGDFSTESTSLVKDPDSLGSRLVTLVEDLFDLYEDANQTFYAALELFDFGDSDVVIQPTTAGLIERKRNRDTLNASIQATALSRAYLAAAEIDLGTVEEVDRVSGILEAQFQKIRTGGLVSATVLRNLTNLRSTTNNFFDQQRDVRPQIVEVRAPLTTARVLAFQYFGSSELSETIAGLNDLDDYTVEGQTRILSS